MQKSLVILFMLVQSFAVWANYEPKLEELVDSALRDNHVLKAVAEDSRAEKKLVSSKYNLPDPSIGLTNLNRGNETEYLTVQQKVRFPVKYWLEGRAQKRIYQSSQNQLVYTKFKLREQIVNLYYGLYTIQKTIELTQANLKIVKDFARIAEKRYASGKSSQSDSMKAHFEITQLEIDLLNLEQDEVSLQSRIKALLGSNSSEVINLQRVNILKPVIKKAEMTKVNNQIEKFVRENSPELMVQEKKLDAAKIKRSLAKWEFAPDFSIQYQERRSGLPVDSKIVSVNATIPLWFWKNSDLASHASAKANAAEYRYKDMSVKIVSQFKSLKVRIEKVDRTLSIYKTTLMPQAEGAYRSTHSAYKAGRTTFLNLLDSERSLYRVKQDYYRNLMGFVKDVSEMESLLGKSISNLYGINGVMQ